MHKNYLSLFIFSGVFFVLSSFVACSKNSAPKVSTNTLSQLSTKKKAETPNKDSLKNESIPKNYKDIQYNEFKYIAPNPSDYKVTISDRVSGYIVSNRNLPLVNLTVYFEESNIPNSIQDKAASEMLGAMIRRGGGGNLTAHALDDSLEFMSAALSTSAKTFVSLFDIDCLSKDYQNMLNIAKTVLKEPTFDKEQLEILKANYVTAYERRYDTPAKVLSALKAKMNYAPNNRLWDASLEEYKKVSVEDIKRLFEGVYSSNRIIFALSGDVDKDSAIIQLKEFFSDFDIKPSKLEKRKPTQISFINKPGTYIVNKEISQANISMNQPFVKRPHVDYYPTAVASFILGGGSFTSRLMNRVRSDEGLAYSIYSSTGNDYRDTAMTTIALQTKVESADFAIKIIFEEIEKLAKEGPTKEELEQAKKAIVESLPSLFDSPESTAQIFAKDELLGKKQSHYIDFVNEVNAVTREQVKLMIAKYFDKNKMTISIVGPVDKLEKLKPFTVVPLDSLEFR